MLQSWFKCPMQQNRKLAAKFTVSVVKVSLGHNFQVFGHTRRSVVTFEDENLQSFCWALKVAATWHWRCFMAPVFSFVLLVKTFLLCIRAGHNQICPLLSIVSFKWFSQFVMLCCWYLIRHFNFHPLTLQIGRVVQMQKSGASPTRNQDAMLSIHMCSIQVCVYNVSVWALAL